MKIPESIPWSISGFTRIIHDKSVRPIADFDYDDDCAYAVHAANLYPKMLAALEALEEEAAYAIHAANLYPEMLALLKGFSQVADCYEGGCNDECLYVRARALIQKCEGA